MRTRIVLSAGVALLIAISFAALRPARVHRLIRWAVLILNPNAQVRPGVSTSIPGTRLEPESGLPTSGAPDLLLVLIDTLRADHLGAYGYARATSPYIDRLAAEGVLFERMISQAPWTIPAVLSLMTGRYPSDLGLPSPSAAPAVLPAEGLTLAERFQAGGYRTVALSDHPAITYSGFGRGFETFDSLPRAPFGRWGWAETEASVVIERWSQLLDRTDARPTFAYLHLYYPHAPYEPPPPFDLMFGQGALLTREPFRRGVVNHYDGEIRRTDDLLSRLIPRFHSLGSEQSGGITVITSDHGEAFWEHGRLGHDATLYNELLHVPLVIHAPGRLARGVRVKALAQTVDLLPTLLEAAGLGLSEAPDVRGRSLLRDIDPSESAPLEEWAISESPVQGPQLRSIQTASLKVIRGLAGVMAYQLADDPGELRPLSLAMLPGSSRLNLIHDDIRAPTVLGHPIDPESLELLRALGYAQGAPPPRGKGPTK